MASENSAYGKPQAFERSVLTDCLDGILRARGSETATRRKHRRYASLIEKDGNEKHHPQTFLYVFPNLLHRYFKPIVPLFQTYCVVVSNLLCRCFKSIVLLFQTYCVVASQMYDINALTKHAGRLLFIIHQSLFIVSRPTPSDDGLTPSDDGPTPSDDRPTVSDEETRTTGIAISCRLQRSSDASKRFFHTAADGLHGWEFAGDADESDGESAVLSGHEVAEWLFLQSVGFAYQTFHAVTVDCIVESLLRNTDEDGDGCAGLFLRRWTPVVLHLQKDHTKGEGNKRGAAAFKQAVDEQIALHTLCPCECMSCLLHLRFIMIDFRQSMMSSASVDDKQCVSRR